MKDYEMYSNDTKVGITNIFWDNITDKYKKSIIKSLENSEYKVLKNIGNIQMYELEYILNNKDDLYDIVKKYINDDKDRFKEIDKIKKYNNIKKLRKDQNLKILVSENLLDKLNLTINDVDLNSLINAKIYFINKSCETNRLNEVKLKLDKIINNFKNIINSTQYSFYTDKEKRDIQNKAINMFNDLILIVEDKTNYKFGKHFSIPLKIKCNK